MEQKSGRSLLRPRHEDAWCTLETCLRLRHRWRRHAHLAEKNNNKKRKYIYMYIYLSMWEKIQRFTSPPGRKGYRNAHLRPRHMAFPSAPFCYEKWNVRHETTESRETSWGDWVQQEGGGGGDQNGRGWILEIVSFSLRTTDFTSFSREQEPHVADRLATPAVSERAIYR